MEDGMTTPVGAIGAMVSGSGKSRRQISLEMGRHENFLTTKIQERSSPRADSLAEIAAACGYQLQLVGHGEVIVIDPPERKVGGDA